MMTMITTAMAIMYEVFIFFPLFFVTSDNVDSIVISIPTIITIDYIEEKLLQKTQILREVTCPSPRWRLSGIHLMLFTMLFFKEMG